MLWFLPTFDRSHGFPDAGWRSDGEPYRLYATLAEAEAAGVAPDGRLARILVLDGDALDVRQRGVSGIPKAAVLNVDPDGDHWRPAAVGAAGGVVARSGEGGTELLLIFRRGAWDLPKGKLDEGETVREAALREVAEEVGIDEDTLAITADLGDSVHGYLWPKAGVYAGKTTRWYAMTTTAEAFEPEEREGIEAVDWTPIDEARQRVGFDTLRDLLTGLDAGALGL